MTQVSDVETAEAVPVAGDHVRNRLARGGRFPWSLAGALFIGLVTLGALGVVLTFSPTVGPADLQRRDRLSDEGQFVDATYRYFLGRPADGAGLAEYQELYEREGAQAVARAIVASREFALRHPDAAQQSDLTALADTFVASYASGAFAPATPPDWPGRLAFVVMLGLCASALVVLQRLAAKPLEGSALHVYMPRWFIVGLFSALAGLWFLNTQALFYSFTPGSMGYAEWLDRLANLAIAQGLARVWTPYPQGAPVLLVLLEATANTIAGYLHSDVWTGYTLFRWLFQAVFLLLPSIVLVSTTYRVGMLLSPATATVAAIIVGFSFAPLYYGVTSTAVVDPLPACLTLVAVWLLLCRHPAWAGLALAAAGALKLIPILLLLPAFVLLASWRDRSRLLVVCAVVLACVFVPFAVADADMFWSPLRWQSGRPPWESLYAFANWLVGAPHEYTQPAFEDLGVGHGFGWVFWGITPPLTALTTAVPTNPLRWENVVAAVGALASLLAIFGATASGPRALVRWALFVLAVTFFWSPGWSPQYELYLVPLVALAFESPVAALAAVLALEIPTFLEYPLLLPWAYFYGGSAVWLAWSATLARYLVLGWLALNVVRGEASLAAFRSRLGRIKRPVVMANAASVAMALGILALPTPTHAQAAGCEPTAALPPATPMALGDRDFPILGGWFFTEAAPSPEFGYRIVDDDSARMWSEFNRLGGWQVLGFPASQRFVWHGQLSQVTQRAILQWSPLTGQAQFANVLDLMHDAGRDADLLASNQIPPPLDMDEAGLPFETIAANRLEWLEERPAIKAAYCDAPGGGDPVQLWGLPTSKEVNMSQSGGEVYVLRTQRAAFQEWVDGADFAPPGAVTIVLAGDLAKELDLLPASALVSEPAPR